MATQRLVRPEDTPGQARVLRTHCTAKAVRRRYYPGTLVQPRRAANEGAIPGSPVGVVRRHVPGTNAQGGHLVIEWPNGAVGNHSAAALAVYEVPAA